MKYIIHENSIHGECLRTIIRATTQFAGRDTLRELERSIKAEMRQQKTSPPYQLAIYQCPRQS